MSGTRTLKIDPDAHDLVLNPEKEIVEINGAETVAQCVRLTLEAFQGEWFLDTGHGTDYEQILGDGTGDPETVLRAAIFQETNVQYIDRMEISRQGRQLCAAFSGRLADGTKISLEVRA